MLQIWVVPQQSGLEPGYEQKAFAEDERINQLRLVADPDGTQGAVKVNQDVRLYTTTLTEDHEVSHQIEPGRHIWVQVVRGHVDVNGASLREGDGAALQDEPAVVLSSSTGAEILLFDLA